MNKILCLILFTTLFLACGSAELQHVEVDLTYKGKPLSQSYVIIFPEGFNTKINDNYKKFYTIRSNEDGRIHFQSNESQFYIIASDTQSIYVGSIKKQKKLGWRIELVHESPQPVLDQMYEDINSNNTMYCHLSWCRWKFCERCCVSSGFEGCYHFYREEK